MNSLIDKVEMEPKIKNDEFYFLQILPEVVWKNVLVKVEDPVDFECAINASQYFRKHLLPRRTTVLFPKVFTFLASRYDVDNSKVYDDVIDEDDVLVAAVDPENVWKYPGGYRMVCRKWNQAVTDYYQNHPSHFLFAMDEADQDWPRTGRSFGYYDREYIRPNCLQFFQETHNSDSNTPNRNPLFQRSLHVSVNSGDIRGVVNAVVENFLETYGQEVWYLYLLITNTNDTLTEFYFALKYLLEKVPNLKVLHLWYTKGRWQSWRAKSQLRRSVKLNPLNGFPNLEFLEVIQNLPAPILNELLMKNRQVYKLDILAAGHNIFSLHWPNLTELSIRIRSWLEFIQLKVLGSRWQLKTFQGFFTNWGSDETLSQVFEMVEKNWAKSLRNLHIWRPSNFIDPKHIFQLTLRNKLNLPLLTTFRLTINQSVGLDFLLPSAKNLESIIIHRPSGFKKVNKRKYGNFIWIQHVQFLGFETNLEKSNIWSKFPKLKKILSGAGTYNRP